MADAPTTVCFHYLKSNAYRVIHADGVVGGPTPSGFLHMSLFSERLPIPTVIDYALTDVGGGRKTLGDEVARDGKQGVVREVDVGIVMSIDMAKELHAWLDSNIKRLEASLQRNNDGGGPDAA